MESAKTEQVKPDVVNNGNRNTDAANTKNEAKKNDSSNPNQNNSSGTRFYNQNKCLNV